MTTALAPTLTVGEVAVGDTLPPLDVPLTRTVIVSTAIASRDYQDCLLYTSPSPRDGLLSRMPSSA